MRVLVYGLGRSGTAVSQLLHKQGHEVVVFDDVLAKGEGLISDWETLTLDPAAARVDLCIAAPGVPFDHPDLRDLRDRGLETIGEVEWVYRSVDAPLVGISGTAGKTSVTRWLTDVLQHAGLDAVAGGNIDPALAAVAEPGKLLVAELSSFQLERSPTLKPAIAILLNVATDHLDRHGSLAAYHAAKRAITANQTENDVLIYNVDEPLLRHWAQASRARAQGFSTTGVADAYLTDAPDPWLVVQGEPLLASSELNVSGRHQWANALAVALAAWELGVSSDQLRQGLRAFRGVAGRYTAVKKLGDITFVEDSIATRGLAVRAALLATPAPVVWIAGGADKGAAPTELVDLVRERVSLFIGLGEAGPSFARAFEAHTQTFLCSQREGEAALRCACRHAVEHLRREHDSRGTVLLAPLAASFDQFKDYRARAQAFRRAAEEMETAWTSC